MLQILPCFLCVKTIRDELSSIVKEIDSHNEVVNKLKKDWEEKNAQAIEDNSAIEEVGRILICFFPPLPVRSCEWFFPLSNILPTWAQEIERLEREADSLKEQRREEQAKFRTEVAEFRKRENEFYEALRRKQAAELFMVEHDFKDSLEKKFESIFHPVFQTTLVHHVLFIFFASLVFWSRFCSCYASLFTWDRFVFFFFLCG